MMMRRLGVLLALLVSVLGIMTLSGCASAPAFKPIPVVGPGYRIPDAFRVVGYFPSWSGNPDSLQYPALTHINYAFLSPRADGTYCRIDEPGKLAKLIALAHSYDVKVCISLGGWNDGKTSAFDTISADPGLMTLFLSNTMEILDRYCLDGVDVDVEFPTEKTKAQYTALIHALAERLHPEGKTLTLAVSADAGNGDSISDDAIADADFINIMAYDDGLGTRRMVHHSTYGYAERSLDYWIDRRNVPQAKAVLGVPFYGRNFTTRRAKTFRSIVEDSPDALGKDLSHGYGYNGFTTIREKAINLGQERGGGIMIWQLNQDASGSNSLLNAIFDAVKVSETRDPVSGTKQAN
jgi:chitinase